MNVRRFGHGLFVLVVCLATATRAVLAQGEAAIHGTVTARADGSALPGASCRTPGRRVTCADADNDRADGHFAFPRLVPADYVLIVTHADFSEQRYRLSLKPREVYNLEVALALGRCRNQSTSPRTVTSVGALAWFDVSHAKQARGDPADAAHESAGRDCHVPRPA